MYVDVYMTCVKWEMYTKLQLRSPMERDHTVITSGRLIGRACSAQGTYEKCMQNFIGNPKRQRYSQNNNIKMLKEVGCVIAEIRMFQYRKPWQGVMNKVKSVRVHKRWGRA